MRRFGSSVTLVALAAVLVAGLALTALAAEEGGDDGQGGVEATTTTLASGLTPAVPVNVEEGVPAQEDWTYRYMVPTGLALAAIIILLTSIKYFTDVVRKRYRIVEE